MAIDHRVERAAERERGGVLDTAAQNDGGFASFEVCDRLEPGRVIGHGHGKRTR